MILRVEKQKEVQVAYTDVGDNVAMQFRTQGLMTTNTHNNATMLVKTNPFFKGLGRRGYRKMDVTVKKNRYCDYCNKGGHTKEACFRLYGYPEWFKEYNEIMYGNGATGKNVVNMVGSPLEFGTNVFTNQVTLQSPALNDLIQKELMKIVKEKLQVDSNQVNFAHLGDFAGEL